MKRNMKSIFTSVLMMFVTLGFTQQIIQKPIIFDKERETLSLEYMEQRYGLQAEEATINPQMVVVHWTAIPTMEKTFKTFNKSRLPNSRTRIKGASNLNVSSQYLIDRDGVIYQLLPDITFARHVIGLNHCAIGIENVGDGNESPLTTAQLKANISLIKSLAEKYNIEYVIGHHEYTNFIGHPLWKETDPNYLTQKTDPGDAFMHKIRSSLKDLNLKDVPEKKYVGPHLDSLLQRLDLSYDIVKEKTITHRRFKHADIQPLIRKLMSNPSFSVMKMGSSVEGRDISLISYGNGPVDVLLWSQMHGDEPTATMALMDIFNFLSTTGEFEDFKKMLDEKITLHFIPMLNPDGADKFKRRNAMGVDLNRDALRLQNPESRILKYVRDSLDADWGFNLHDQNRYYAAGLNPKTASISFLAPAYNYEKEINKVRHRSMQLIGIMNEVLQGYIPGKVGRYNDDFEPRAFGDNIQKWGTSTILIESGGLVNDREKQELRKLNYLGLLSAFYAIAQKDYESVPRAEYEQIPFNDSNSFHDVIIRKVNVPYGEEVYVLDIGLRFSEHQGTDDFIDLKAYVMDIGDLSTAYGYEEIDVSNYIMKYGMTYPETYARIDDLSWDYCMELLNKGYTSVLVKEKINPRKAHNLPIKILNEPESNSEIQQGLNPSLLFIVDGVIVKALINGRMIELNN